MAHSTSDANFTVLGVCGIISLERKMKMKIPAMISMAMLVVSLFAEPPTYDWNDRVTRCAFGSSDTLKSEMGRLDSAKQALLARDVVKSISLFPNPRARLIARMSDAIFELVEFSNPDVKRFVEMMAWDSVPEDMKEDVTLIVALKRKNKVKHIMPNASSGMDGMMSELQTLSTNSAYQVDRTTTDNMQSDIGVLRVPAKDKIPTKRGSKVNPDWVEPQPYRLQNL